MHQTHDMISVYPITIISHPYLTSYHILSLSYHIMHTKRALILIGTTPRTAALKDIIDLIN